MEDCQCCGDYVQDKHAPKYNGQKAGDQSQTTPSMATKSRQVIAPSIFRLGCMIFCDFTLLQGKRHGSRSPTSSRQTAYATETLWLQIPEYHTTIPPLPPIHTSHIPAFQHNAARRRTRQGPQPRQEIHCFKNNRCYSSNVSTLSASDAFSVQEWSNEPRD